MVPDENQVIQEGMKVIKNGKHVSKHNRLLLFLFSLKYVSMKAKIVMYYGAYNVQYNVPPYLWFHFPWFQLHSLNNGQKKIK